MKRIIAVILSLFAITTLSAQKQEYLAPFTALDVDAPVKLTLVKIMEHEAPYIIYDTKDAENPKFSFEIKDDKLKVRERNDSKRKAVTEVTIGFTKLTDISIAKADTKVDGVLNSKIIDIYISKDAHFTAEVDVLDVMITLSLRTMIASTSATAASNSLFSVYFSSNATSKFAASKISLMPSTAFFANGFSVAIRTFICLMSDV